MLLRSMFPRVIIALLAFPAMLACAEEETNSTPVPIRIPSEPGRTAPFVVDVTTLFTNDIHELTFDELTNFLAETRADLTETSTVMPDLRAQKRDAQMKAMRENPAVLEIRRQVEELKKKANDLVQEDPNFKAAAERLVSAQQDVMILSKKIQLLTQEVSERQQVTLSATGTETNTP